MRQVKDPSKRIFTVPNILSMFRILLIPLIVWLYIGKQDYKTAGYVLLLSGATDILDGFIARRFNLITDLGKALDPIADKLTQGVMMLCLVIRFPLIKLPLALFVVKELFMAGSGLWIMNRKRRVPQAKWHGKTATVLLYAMMFLHIFLTDISRPLSLFSVGVTSVIIALSLILYVFDLLRDLKS